MGLREPVGTFRRRGSVESAIDALSTALERLGLSVINLDRTRGQLTVSCLSRVASWVLWRCWSDRVVIDVRASSGDETEVTVNAVPNLWRIRLKAHERVWDLERLMAELRRA